MSQNTTKFWTSFPHTGLRFCNDWLNDNLGSSNDLIFSTNIKISLDSNWFPSLKKKGFELRLSHDLACAKCKVRHFIEWYIKSNAASNKEAKFKILMPFRRS